MKILHEIKVQRAGLMEQLFLQKKDIKIVKCCELKEYDRGCWGIFNDFRNKDYKIIKKNWYQLNFDLNHLLTVSVLQLMSWSVCISKDYINIT